ncbi:hypothetical protein GQ473_00945 [archaeon]|nr:hypothetical protein [archaeon]
MEINEHKTLQYFGYTSDMLSSNSKEPVIVYCNQVGSEIGVQFLKYNKFCKDCKELPISPCLK